MLDNIYIMKHLKYYNNFVTEMNIDMYSNYAPLYHFTDTFYLTLIIKSDTLKLGITENPIFGDYKKIVSFTRLKTFDFRYFKEDTNIRITFDTHKLRNEYRLYPYDFFINTKKENNPKSNILRKEIFEYEEVVLSDIKNIHKYITNIHFIIKNDPSKNNKNVITALDKLLILNDKITITYNE